MTMMIALHLPLIMTQFSKVAQAAMIMTSSSTKSGTATTAAAVMTVPFERYVCLVSWYSDRFLSRTNFVRDLLYPKSN
jgi:hypothetical protein